MIGSTDHHAAHPGSYGGGRAAVWANGLTREAIWDALVRRRTYALTGDRIMLAVALNGHPIGADLAFIPERHLDVTVEAGDAIDYVDVVHNGRLLHRWTPAPTEPTAGPCRVILELGWGDRATPVEWRVDLTVENGRLLKVEPRLRGRDVLSPQEEPSAGFVLSAWERTEGRVVLRTMTWGNPNPLTPGTQAISLALDGDVSTRITGHINDKAVDVPPAYRFGRAVGREASAGAFSLEHRGAGSRDWYYARVRQTNHQWAWSSPIWVG